MIIVVSSLLLNRSMQKGFTLIELMLYVGLVALFAGLIGAFVPIFLSERVVSQSMTDVYSQARYVASVVSDHVRDATDITFPATSTASTTLIVSTTDVATDPTTIFLDSGRIYISEAGSASVPLTDTNVVVNQFEVVNYSATGPADTVTVFLEIGRNATSTFQAEIYEYTRSFKFTVSRRIR